MRAKLRAVIGIEPALEKISHDAGLDELPIGFACDSELANFLFSQLKHRRLFEQMAIEMTNLVRTERAALGIFWKKILNNSGKWAGLSEPCFKILVHTVFRWYSVLSAT